MSYNLIVRNVESKKIVDTYGHSLGDDQNYGLHFASALYNNEIVSVTFNNCRDRIHFVYSTAPLFDMNYSWVPRSEDYGASFCNINENLTECGSDTIEAISLNLYDEHYIEETAIIAPNVHNTRSSNEEYEQQFLFTAHENLKIAFVDKPVEDNIVDNLLWNTVCRHEIQVENEIVVKRNSSFPYVYIIDDKDYITFYNLDFYRNKDYVLYKIV
ncbi:hypothetical protein QKV36_gp040 [Erannis ankeraria nucleopolyhedrovirus]|uniref:hypothetical protein n=1 Tax=Erannis ankeraria nucleopolyhedrovirus TaxID=2913600 RepID=UPI00117B4C91|nr:hypothetical protein QKV36_gp040 [Erannis ankeraria nucleopolyhedrovirus]UJZ88988.1 hypothetical protein Erangp040 [Erannis ankeraria nucleopolyhedrovirus]